MASTSEGYHEYKLGGYLEYIGVCSVQRWDIKNHVGGYHKYVLTCSVHWRGIVITSAGYYEYIGECSVHQTIYDTCRKNHGHSKICSVHWDFQFKCMVFIPK